ncbi:MAG: hypothetical protein R3A51_10745 [Nannocystaceae bacterium]|nr:hypothetical protein [Myxococcales bacterium]
MRSLTWLASARVMLAPVLIALVTACSSKANEDGSTAALTDFVESDGDEPTTAGPSTSGTDDSSGSVSGPDSTTDPTEPDATSGTDATGCRDDRCPPATDAGAESCDIIAQDCPDGEKCMPYAIGDGAFWDANRCVPVAPNPSGPGESCMVSGGPTSGVDDCDAHSMCYNVDPFTLEGVCVEFCTGEMFPYECSDPLAHCRYANDGVVAVCLTTCEPTEQNCGDGQGCYPKEGEFHCDWDMSGEYAEVGTGCEAHNECPAGMFCAPGSRVVKCQYDQCCAEFCDPKADENTCWGAELDVKCLPYNEALVELKGTDEDVGACLLP